jgi:hypothetical protein
MRGRVSSQAEAGRQAQLRRRACADLPSVLRVLKGSSRGENLAWAMWRDYALCATAMTPKLSVLTSRFKPPQVFCPILQRLPLGTDLHAARFV